MLAKLRIVIVDDDPVFRMIMSMMISRINKQCEVVQLGDGEELMTHLDEIGQNGQSFPQLLFLDLNMPSLSGEETLARLEDSFKASLEHTRTYMLTSSVDPDDEQIASKYSVCTGFLVKPMAEEQLANLLQATA